MKVVICGAGIAGLTLAICLERYGHSVLIVERAPRLRDDGYPIDFFGSGYEAMGRIGLLPQIAAIHEPISHVVFRDAKGSDQTSIPYEVLRQRLFRGQHFNFMRGSLERLLKRQLTTSAIRFCTTVSSFEEDHRRIHVRLSDGTTRVVDLLVGADGVHSGVRRLTFPHERCIRPLGYEAVAFIVDSPPAALEIGRNLVTATAPHAQATLCPTADGRLAAFFIHEVDRNPRGTTRGTARPPFRQRYRDFGWIVPDLLTQCEMAGSVYSETLAQVDLPRWSKGRVVLLGDACQCLSPLAGQGASLTVASAYVLAAHLSEDCALQEALAAYERALKPAVTQQQAAARRIAHWFVPASKPRLCIRNVMTRAIVWPPVASVLRRQMAAASVFG